MFHIFLTRLNWWKTTIILEEKQTKLTFKEGELWWCSIGMNVGVEIYGKGDRFTRPVVVFRKFNTNSFLGIPLTTKLKNGKWYVPLEYDGIKSRAVLSQARIFDSRRLIGEMGMFNGADFQAIKTAFLKAYAS